MSNQPIEQSLENIKNFAKVEGVNSFVLMVKNGGMVYGLVEIDRSDLDKYLYLGNIFINTNKLYHILSTNNCFTSNGQIINDYNSIIDTIV